MSFEPIAVVGQACLLPDANTPEQLWQNILAKKCAIKPIPEKLWGISKQRLTTLIADKPRPAFTDMAGWVTDDEVYENLSELKFDQNILRQLDPLFLWVLNTARNSLTNAKLWGSDFKNMKVGAILGNLGSPTSSLNSLATAHWLENLGLETKKQHSLNRFNTGLPAHLLAQCFNFTQGAFSLDAACASALYAVKYACDFLHDQKADIMLAGAVNCIDWLYLHGSFSTLQVLSSTGQSRPFNKGADGIVPAQGCAFLVLKRLDDALRDANQILGIIKGVGLSNDGKTSSGFFAPSAIGQYEAMKKAYTIANIDPGEISLVECHATGTILGDLVEIQSMAKIFGTKSGLKIGSLKSNLGHLISVSGMAGIIKIIKAFENKTLPPTINAKETSPEIEQFGFSILHDAEPWLNKRRIASLNSFGFGGNNAHLIIEEFNEIKTANRVFLKDPNQQAEKVNNHCPIAVIGLEIMLAGANNDEEFLERILEPTDLLNQEKIGNEIGRISRISLPLNGVSFSPNELKEALPQQLSVLNLTLKALKKLKNFDPKRCSVVVGSQANIDTCRFAFKVKLEDVLQQSGNRKFSDLEIKKIESQVDVPPNNAASSLGHMPTFPANRINRQFNILGPSFAVFSEELSGIRALKIAISSLKKHEIDVAIVAATDFGYDSSNSLSIKEILNLNENLVDGDGTCLLVLKRQSDAIDQNEQVFATIEEDSQNPTAPQWSIPKGFLAEKFGHVHSTSGLLEFALALKLVQRNISPWGIENHEKKIWSPFSNERKLKLKINGMAEQFEELLIQKAPSTHNLIDSTNSTIKWHIYFFVGETLAALKENLKKLNYEAPNEKNKNKPRIVIVCKDLEITPISQKAGELLATISENSSAQKIGDGIFWAPKDSLGEIALVYGPGGAAYPQMGLDLLLSYPELVAEILEHQNVLADWFKNEYCRNEVLKPPLKKFDDFNLLLGSTFFSLFHTHLLTHILNKEAGIFIGYSWGEVNALLATGVWPEPETFLNELKTVYQTSGSLYGGMVAIRNQWKIHGVNGHEWANWRILESPDVVLEKMANLPGVHLLMINSPRDCVIGGEKTGCENLLLCFNANQVLPMPLDVPVHCPELQHFHEDLFKFYNRNLIPSPNKRFYSNAQNKSFAQKPEIIARNLADQLVNLVDFRKTIYQAWEDGARTFIEVGPRKLCSDWIDETLQHKEHICLHFDHPASGTSQRNLAYLIGQLLSLGFGNTVSPILQQFLAEKTVTELEENVLVVAAHRANIDLKQTVYPMEPAKRNEPDFSATPFTIQAHTQVNPPSDDDLDEVNLPLLEQLSHSFHKLLKAQEEFYRINSKARLTLLTDQLLKRGQPNDRILSVIEGPKMSRSDLICLAENMDKVKNNEQSNYINSLFPNARLPTLPILVVDRIMGMKMFEKSDKMGIIWAETDIPQETWFLHQSRMPIGMMFELCQSHLILASWLLKNNNDPLKLTHFRLLDFETIFHGTRPLAGDLIRGECYIDRIASSADSLLIYFSCNFFINDELRLEVKNSVGGYFTSEDLLHPEGLPPRRNNNKHSFSNFDIFSKLIFSKNKALTPEMISSFSEGRVSKCFGNEFKLADAHINTPKIQSNNFLFLDEILCIELPEKRVGLGYIKAKKTVLVEDFFFECHFKNDPVMPGSLMIEGAYQIVQIFMTAIGLTIERDGWCFDPVPASELTVSFRGQLTPKSKELIYEVFVIDIIIEDSSPPRVKVDFLCWVDGIRAVMGQNLQVQLTPPLNNKISEYFLITLSNMPWLKDHRPYFIAPTLPMTYIADLHARKAQKNMAGYKVVELENLTLNCFVEIIREVHQFKIQEIESSYVEYSDSLKIKTILSMSQVEYPEGVQSFNEISSCLTTLQRNFSPPPPAYSPLIDAEAIGDIYASKKVFHGPSFHIMHSLRRSKNGASFHLNPDSSSLPSALLHFGILDAATHSVPEKLEIWSERIQPGLIPYPIKIKHLKIYNNYIESASTRGETRFKSFENNSESAPLVNFQIIQNEMVWVEFTIEYMLFPRLFSSTRTPEEIQQFLENKKFFSGMNLSEFNRNGNKMSTHLSKSKVNESALRIWDSVRFMYNVQPNLPLAQIFEIMAVTDHYVERFKIHPSRVKFDQILKIIFIDQKRTDLKNFNIYESETEVVVTSEDE